MHVDGNEGQSIEVIMPTITTDALGLADVDIQILADYSITLVDYAIEAVSEEQSKLMQATYAKSSKSTATRFTSTIKLILKKIIKIY